MASDTPPDSEHTPVRYLRPEPVEAMRIHADAVPDIVRWLAQHNQWPDGATAENAHWVFATREGHYVARIKGEVQIIPADIFENTWTPTPDFSARTEPVAAYGRVSITYGGFSALAEIMASFGSLSVNVV